MIVIRITELRIFFRKIRSAWRNRKIKEFKDAPLRIKTLSRFIKKRDE